jgi:hypothetical protein
MTVSDWWNTVSTSISNALDGVAKFVPDIIGAIIVVLVGVAVGWLLKWVVVEILSALRLDTYFKQLGANKVFSHNINVVELLGDLVKWFVIIVFLIPALQILGLDAINIAVQQLVNYLPNVLLAVVTVLVGMVFADLAARTLGGLGHTIGARSSAVLADVARYSIIILVVLDALRRLGVAEDLINNLLVGLVAMLALAGGLAFGLGGQGVARDVLERLRRSVDTKK